MALNIDLHYNINLSYYIYKTKDINMNRECVYCLNIFNRTSNEKACSLRCKIRSKIDIPVSDVECWIWKLNFNNNRYGRTRWNNKWYSAHRASYIAFNGIIPENMVVCHTCDNTKCVNP